MRSYNLNKKASIGFICDYPFHYYVYKNIYKYLPESEFILTNEIYPISNYYSKKLSEMERFFESKKARWRVFPAGFDNPSDFFSKYEILVSPLYKGCVAKNYNEDKKKVRVLYGPGKDLIDFGIGNCYFDLILTYGKYSQKRLEPYTSVKIVGNPKFDDWFNGDIDKESLVLSGKKLDTGKKTILYAPTYGDLSSIGDFKDKISGLSEKFNLIIKFHHISLWDEQERIKNFLKYPKIIVLPENLDLLPALFAADLALCDNGGAIFDAVLAGKPVVLLGKPEENSLRTMASLKVKRRYLQPGLTYADSIEQKIRRPGNEIGIVVGKHDDLEKAIIKSLIGDSVMAKRRRKLRNELFSFNDGKCGYRAAIKIKNLLGKTKPKEKFLALAVKSYISNLKENLKYANGKKEE